MGVMTILTCHSYNPILNGMSAACDIISNMSEYIPINCHLHECVPKDKINSDNNNRHSKVHGRKLTGLQPYTWSYGQLRNAQNGRKNLLQEGAHQLAI